MSKSSTVIIALSFLFCSLGSTPLQAQTIPDIYWFERAGMPIPRQEMPLALVDNVIYVPGGLLEDRDVTDVFEVYDPVTDTWDTLPNLPIPRHHYTFTRAGDKVYAIGGYDVGPFPNWVPTDYVHSFDPATETWAPLAPMIQPQGEHTAVEFGGDIYVIGGKTNGINQVYKPDSNSWSILATMPTPRNHAAAAVIDSLIYVVGGRDDLVNTPALEAYSPASNTWYTLPDMPTARSGLAVAVMNGKLYAFGGELPTMHDEVEEYDPATNSWLELGNMRTQRHGMQAVTIGDTIFIIGGGPGVGWSVTEANEGFVIGTCVDSDFDGIGNPNEPANTCVSDDNCIFAYNPFQENSDTDSLGDACDNCLFTDNPVQEDLDSDFVGDSCDNCIDLFNPNQADTNFNNIGDACECFVAITGDVNNSGSLTSSDVIAMVNFIFKGGAPYIPCEAAGDVNCSGSSTSADIIYMVNHVFKGAAAPCNICSIIPSTWSCP